MKELYDKDLKTLKIRFREGVKKPSFTNFLIQIDHLYPFLHLFAPFIYILDNVVMIFKWYYLDCYQYVNLMPPRFLIRLSSFTKISCSKVNLHMHKTELKGFKHACKKYFIASYSSKFSKIYSIFTIYTEYLQK